jgi:MFS family permease
MIPDSPAIDPPLRDRLPLYPSQLLGAMVLASFGPLLDTIMSSLEIPLSRAGIISGGFFLGGVIGIVLANTAIAKMPAKWTLILGMAGQGVFLLVAALASRDLWSLTAAYFVVGIIGAPVNTICWAWIAAHAKRNPAVAALQLIFFFALGMVITPPILGVVLDQGVSWRWVLAFEGGLSLVLAVAYLFLPLLDVAGRRNVRLPDLRQVLAHDHKLLLGMVAACFMYCGAETTLNVWLPKFQIDIFGSGDTWASLSLAFFWIGLVAGRLGVMPLAKRFSPARLLLACACTLAVFCVVLAVAPTRTATLVLSVGAGLGASASYGLIGSYSGRFPDWQSGVASSAFILAGGLGSVVFPYLMGPIASAAGFRVALGLIAVPAVAYGLFSFLLQARARW